MIWIACTIRVLVLDDHFVGHDRALFNLARFLLVIISCSLDDDFMYMAIALRFFSPFLLANYPIECAKGKCTDFEAIISISRFSCMMVSTNVSFWKGKTILLWCRVVF